MKSAKSMKTKSQTSKPSGLPGARKVTTSKYRSYLLYGRSGTGKTTLAATFPTPILFLDVRDEGLDSVADIEGVEFKEIDNLDEFEDVYWWLKENPGHYKTVVIDTVSQLQDLSILDTLGGKMKKGKSIGDWGTMSQRQWGQVSSYMKEWLVNFRDLTKDDMNIIFLAQERVDHESTMEVQVDGQIAPEVGAMLSPGTVKVLNAAVSVIGNTFIRSKIIKKEVNGKTKREERIEFCLRIGPSSVHTTKVRKNRDIEVPSFLSDPSYQDIIEVIKGE